ncbi:PH domain-containing protein [Brevibacterium sp. NPDC049920]|mgnify:CR=1 FL=1|uniref:Low molecular weight protein antigen 6 PH domain-containing protein n=1 Tax=Brevibacterium pityocampae TaxID=506594 RepID=A0ABP8JIB8_9MICO|nr:PH domain-containing protein [uncultured Brevibacterium sp.]
MTAHTPPPPAPQSSVLRTGGSRLIVATVGLTCAIALVTVMLQAPPGRAAGLAGIAVAPAVLAWVLYGHPHLRIAPDGLWIANPLRTHDVPWSAITGLDERLGLSVERTDGGPIAAWALPAAGRGIVRTTGTRARIAARTSPQIAAVHAARAASAAAPADRAGAVVESRWNVPNLVLLGLAASWFAIGLATL